VSNVQSFDARFLESLGCVLVRCGKLFEAFSLLLGTLFSELCPCLKLSSDMQAGVYLLVDESLCCEVVVEHLLANLSVGFVFGVEEIEGDAQLAIDLTEELNR